MGQKIHFPFGVTDFVCILCSRQHNIRKEGMRHQERTASWSSAMHAAAPVCLCMAYCISLHIARCHK